MTDCTYPSVDLIQGKTSNESARFREGRKAVDTVGVIRAELEAEVYISRKRMIYGAILLLQRCSTSRFSSSLEFSLETS